MGSRRPRNRRLLHALPLLLLLLSIPSGGSAEPIALWHLAKTGGTDRFRVSEEPVYSVPIQARVREGNRVLLDLVNRGFSATTSEELSEVGGCSGGRWGAGTVPWQKLVAGVGLLVAVLFGVLAWAASLRRKVRKVSASLRSVHGELENRVRERTAELDTANRKLREQASARARAETALHESEKRFRTAFLTSPDSININRLADGLYEDINDGFTEITGYTADEVIGKTSIEIDIWADPADRAKLIEGLRRDGVVRNLEARFRMKDGRVIRGLMSARVIDLGGVPHILSVARNIEEWVRAQEVARESEARLESVLESLPFEFFAFDPQGRCTVVNSRARIRWGHVVGRPLAEISDDTQVGARWEEGFRRALTGEILEDDWERHRDGQRVVFHSVIAPIAGPDGILGVQALNVDVTERRELEEQLAHAQKMEAVGTLASGIAHDFNNLLQAILGFAELGVMVPGVPEKARAHLEKIDAAARSAAELVRSLLTYGRREKPRLERLILNRQVEEVVDLLGRTVPKMISIETRLADDMEPCLGDARQLEQVLLNLGTNARDAMPEGGRLFFETDTVTLTGDPGEVPRSAPPGRYVRCTVTDTGVGMDEATVQRIFDPFFTTKQVGEGTGLGLSTAYGVVKNHGGVLVCDSAPGEGTRFELYLPVHPEGAAETPESLVPEKSSPRGRGTILVVDDEEFVRDVAGAALEALGYTVWTTESGERALELLEQRGGGVDLVLLDLGMPGMGGRRCLEKLRVLRPDLPVLVASGYGRATQAEVGATGFLSKPYSLDDLARRVGEILGS